MKAWIVAYSICSQPYEVQEPSSRLKSGGGPSVITPEEFLINVVP